MLAERVVQTPGREGLRRRRPVVGARGDAATLRRWRAPAPTKDAAHSARDDQSVTSVTHRSANALNHEDISRCRQCRLFAGRRISCPALRGFSSAAHRRLSHLARNTAAPHFSPQRATPLNRRGATSPRAATRPNQASGHQGLRRTSPQRTRLASAGHQRNRNHYPHQFGPRAAFGCGTRGHDGDRQRLQHPRV